MTTFEPFDMGVRTSVDEGAAVTISDRLASTTGPAPLVHWSYRQTTDDVVTVTVDGVTETFALTAQPVAGTVGVGAQIYPTHPSTNAHLDYAAVLAALPPNLTFTRVGVPWRLLQPTSSAWDETEAGYFDSVFAALNTAGLDVILTVGTTPTWALASGTDTLMPPADPATFGAWVDAVIDRWSGVVNIVGIDPWNEPNEAASFKGTDAQFVAMVQAAHTAAAGRVPIAPGSLALADHAYLDGLFDLGLTGADFDYIDVHPYPIAFTPDGLAMRWVNPHRPPPTADVGGSLIAGCHEIERVLADRGIASGAKPFWLSEWGVSSNPVDDASPAHRMTDARAADWHSTVFDQAARMSVIEGVCVHEASDITGGASGWNSRWGMLRPNLTRRPKWSAVAAA